MNESGFRAKVFLYTSIYMDDHTVFSLRKCGPIGKTLGAVVFSARVPFAQKVRKNLLKS